MIAKIVSVFAIWKSKEPELSKQNDVLYYTNELFKHIVNEYTWYFYGISGLIIFLCLCNYFRDYKRRAEMRRQHEELQRVAVRTAQRRRPGAIYREHEIFRNVMQTVHEYTNPEDAIKDSEKSELLHRTRNVPDDERSLVEESNN